MSSSSSKTARYGSWKSPITSELIVSQSITLSEVCLDGGHVYWLEGRPQEQGRYVVVRAGADGQPTDITPPPYNARTRVHEYGGGSWTVRNGMVYFSNFRGRPPLSAVARRVRAAGVHARAAGARAAVAIRRRRDRSALPPLDRRARGSHRRRRAGQRHRRRRFRRRQRARTRARERARFLRFAAALAGWTLACMARLGSSQYAVERHAALPGRGRSKWRNQQCRTHRRRSDRIDLPTGMVTRGRANCARVGSLRLVESLFARSRDASDAGARANGGGVWFATMVARHVDLRFRRA